MERLHVDLIQPVSAETSCLPGSESGTSRCYCARI